MGTNIVRIFSFGSLLCVCVCVCVCACACACACVCVCVQEGKRVKCFFDKMSTRELGPHGGEEDRSLIYNYVIQSKPLAVQVIYLCLERLRCFTIVFEQNGVTGSD